MSAAAPRRHDICHMMTTTKPKQPMRQTVAIAFVVQGHDCARRTCHMPHRVRQKEMPTQREKGRERAVAIVAFLGQFMQSAKRGSAQKQKHRAHFYYKYKTIFVVKKYIQKAKKLSFYRRGNMHMTIAGNLCAAKWQQNMV